MSAKERDTWLTRIFFTGNVVLVAGLSAAALTLLPRGFAWLTPPPSDLFPPGIHLAGGGARLSILFVIYASIVLFVLVSLLFAYVGLFKAYHLMRQSYREKRKALFRKGIELALMEEPVEQIVEALRPRRPLDAEIVEDVLVDSMRHLKGPPFEALREAALRLGCIERNLRWLKSRERHLRGRAMETLGLMRSKQGGQAILATLSLQPIDLQLVAMRALTSIGDAAALPRFLEICDKLPEPMLTRVASLMLDFGPAAHPHIRELFNKHPGAFPPRVFEEVLKELASDMARGS